MHNIVRNIFIYISTKTTKLKYGKAAQSIETLKQLKPNFEEKAAYLISRFVKEDELVEHVLEGLRKAGMEV